MKKAILILTVFVFLLSSLFATNSRVESMGKRATFFMDDISIYDNPANVNIYPNFLIGEIGRMTQFSGSSSNYANADPSNPYGGGILSFSLNKDKEAETRYPMLCVGAMMNHDNELMDVIMDAAIANKHFIPEPVVPNSDFFLGFTFANGIMVGGHFYAAFQDIIIPGKTDTTDFYNTLKDGGVFSSTATTLDSTMESSIRSLIGNKNSTENYNWSSSIYRGDLGINMPLSQNIDMELGVGIALLDYSGPSASKFGMLTIESYGETDYSYFLNLRLFSTMLSLNGEIVPVVKLKKISIRDYKQFEATVGVGANITLDRGFFWAGLEFIYSDTEVPGLGNETKSLSITQIPLSFGIERNIVWDWFVMRVGFTKVFGTKKDPNGIEMNFSNPEADMTLNDHVGVGVGLNIEEKLKIDGVVAEDIFYKWGNLISGNSHHILSRITATYSF